MIPPVFEYRAPGTLDEAVALLQRFSGEAKVLAGGQSLLPLMKLRLAEPKFLVDLNRITQLAYIREDGDHLRIGSMTRINDLNDSDVIQKGYPLLADAGAHISDPLVRNMGTVGGNVCHGDPGNDLPACMLASGAHFVVLGPEGDRTLPAAGFYRDTFTTALEETEILTEVQVPKARPGDGGAYLKLERKVGDFAIAAVAVHLHGDGQGTIERAGIALTNVAPTALLATKASEHLAHKRGSAEEFRAAARLAAEAAQPTSDLRGPADFKRAVVQTLAERALQRAWDRSQGRG